MIAANHLELSFLDGPTLAFVTVCIVALLGLFLILAWLQQRDVRALAWWGAACLIGASSLALWPRRGRGLHCRTNLPSQCRNRLRTADNEQAGKRARLIAAARGGRTAKAMRLLRRNNAA